MLATTKFIRAAAGMQEETYKALSTFLVAEGFLRSKNDFCLFTVRATNDAMIYVMVWVDDITIGCRSQDEFDKIRSRLSEQFKMDNRGALSWFLGMQVKQSPGMLTLIQSSYINESLERVLA